MDNYAFPQVLLLGNGLNRAFDSKSWKNILSDIHTNSRMNPCEISKAPYPLQAVLATNDNVSNAILTHPQLFLGLDCLNGVRPFVERLLNISFDHILTTNYSYELERVADSRVKNDGKYCKNLMAHTSAVSHAESKYFLHTFNQVQYGDSMHRIWHIHGEARKPSSVILGHYYYGKLLGRYQSELEKRGNAQEWNQENDKPPIITSWLDAFIMGDVYVLGYGYDLSEFDMWWLLSRKKAEKAKHGRLHFYTPIHGNEIVMGLVDAYGGIVHDLGFRTPISDYTPFYDSAIAEIEKSVISKKGM